MFGSQILDTAIGIVFIFVLVSTLVTIGNELIASVLNSRAAWLRVGVERLLGSDLAAALYAHPMVGGAQEAPGNDEPSLRQRWVRLGGLARIWAREGGAQPSYIASRTFANVLLDLVHAKTEVLQSAQEALGRLCGIASPGSSGHTGGGTDSVDAPATDFATFSASARRTADDLTTKSPTVAVALRRLVLQMPASTSLEDARTAVLGFSDALTAHGLQDMLAALPNKKVGDVLRVLLRDAEGDIDVFKANVEIWFNNAMDRVAGWYKRRSQWVVFALGIAIAVAMNIDSLSIIHVLQTSPAARDSLVAQAKAYSAASNSASADPAAHVVDAGVTYTGTLHLSAASAHGGKVLLASDSPRVTLASSQVDLSAGQQDIAVVVQTSASGPAVDASISGKTTGSEPASGTLRLHVGAGLSQQFEAIQSRLLQLDLPIAWVRSANAKESDRRSFNVIPESGSDAVDTFSFHALGWLVTALAATLGAPFWFDMLNRIVAIRSAGKAPEEKPKSPKQVQLPLEPGESPSEAERARAGQS